MVRALSDNPYTSPSVDNSKPIDSRVRLIPVAVSLIVVSVVWIAFALYGIVYFVAFINDPEVEASTRSTYTMSIGSMGVSILYSLVLIFGAFSMVRRGSYVWAVATSCLAMVPILGPCYVLAIPLGIWAFLLLRQPGVRESFQKV